MSNLGLRSLAQRGAVLFALLPSLSIALGQQQAGSRPANARTGAQAEGRQTDASASSEAAPTDAEKIARLQRSVDDSLRQIEELSTKLGDPASEFRQAESAFTELDRQLQEAKKALESLGDGDETRRQKLLAELNEIQPTHKLAKDRFDLAIRERKTLQEQIATLQQKVQQDKDALQKLRGDNPAATQPAPDVASPVPPEQRPAAREAPAATIAPGSEVQLPAGTQTPVMRPVAPPATPGTPVAPEGAKPPAPTPEVIEARKEASRKQEEAKTAQADLVSVAERMNGLRKSIELEQKQFETSRKKAENAQETERTLYESLDTKWRGGSSQSELDGLRNQIVEARARLLDAQAEIRDRTDRLDQYQSDLSALQAEHIAAIEEAQLRQVDAEQAQKHVEHLESPLSGRNLWRWLLERGPRVGAIIVAMAALLYVSRLFEGRFVKLMAARGKQGTPEDRENRARTLVGVVHSATIIAVYASGGLMILTEVGVNIVPLMGGAAVFGLAVAFGAQNLIRDYFYGFMILLESQYHINDVVRIGGVSGQVERITLRVTALRDLDGTVHIVPNGEITRVSNLTHEWSRALFDIPVAYKEDVDRVMNELIELSKELRRDPDFRGLILEMPEMLGVDEFADSAVIIKFLIKTRPLKQWIIKRELLRRIKRRFDELGIEIPFPHRTLYHRFENGSERHSGSVPGFVEQEARA